MNQMKKAASNQLEDVLKIVGFDIYFLVLFQDLSPQLYWKRTWIKVFVKDFDIDFSRQF